MHCIYFSFLFFFLPPDGRCLGFSPKTTLQSTVCHTHQSLCSRSQGCNSPPQSSCQVDAARGYWRRHTNQIPHCCLRRQWDWEKREEKLEVTTQIAEIHCQSVQAKEANALSFFFLATFDLFAPSFPLFQFNFENSKT